MRRTHGYDLTDAGRAMVHELEGVAGRIERITARPAGDALPLVKLSAGTWTTLVLVRRSLELAGDPPDLRIRFLAAEDILSIGRREAAIGIRNRRPTEAGLAGRKLARVHFAAYAGAGRPAGLDTGYTPTRPRHAGSPRARATPPCTKSATRALRSTSRSPVPGAWFCRHSSGRAEPRLTRAGEPIEELSHDQWLVTHDDDRRLPEVRRAIDRVCRILG